MKSHEIGFFYGNDEHRDEIDYIGVIIQYFNGFYLVSPLFRDHDAMIIPAEYRAGVVE